MKYIKAEWLKEKRSSNRHLMFGVPIGFIVFTTLMSSIMAPPPEGRSNLLAVAFNWYPVIILPVVLSLFTINLYQKEAEPCIIKQRSIGISRAKILLAKNIVMGIEVMITLTISGLFLYLMGNFAGNDPISAREIIRGSMFLWIGSLPLLSLSVLLYQLLSGIGVIIVNFMLSLVATLLLATSSYWFLFPWTYNLRLMAAAVGIHPNGTFLPPDSLLLAPKNLFIGAFLSIIIYGVSCVIVVWRERRKENG